MISVFLTSKQDINSPDTSRPLPGQELSEPQSTNTSFVAAGKINLSRIEKQSYRRIYSRAVV